MRPVVHAATACFPGLPVREAIQAIQAGASEPLIGTLSHDQIQLCPQSRGHLDEAECEALRQDFPGTQFRLHANAKVIDRNVRYDASTFGPDTASYYHALADRSRRLGAKAYSLHAGFARNCDLQTMFDNVRRIQEIFGEIQVGLEGLYPTPAMPQLMDCWDDYHAALTQGIPLAVDLSHLQIVEHAQGSGDTALLIELLASPNTIEVHLSDNDGTRDHHDILVKEPGWWPYLDAIGANAVVFSEGNQIRSQRRHVRHAMKPIDPMHPFINQKETTP